MLMTIASVLLQTAKQNGSKSVMVPATYPPPWMKNIKFGDCPSVYIPVDKLYEFSLGK